MHYMLLCCFNEARWNELPAEQRDSIMQSYHEVIEGWIASGRYLSGGKLADSAAATTVRRRGGAAAITDGPFAETKEQLGGFHVLDCRDLDHALALAAQVPTLDAGGTVEVRPLQALLGASATR